MEQHKSHLLGKIGLTDFSNLCNWLTTSKAVRGKYTERETRHSCRPQVIFLYSRDCSSVSRESYFITVALARTYFYIRVRSSKESSSPQLMFPNRIFPSLSVCLSACTCVFPMAKEWILIFIHYPSVIIDPQVGLASRRKKGSRPNFFDTLEPQKPQIWFPNCVQFADRAGLEALTLDNVWSGGGYSFRKIDISHAEEEEEEGDEERKKVVLVSPEFACWMDRPNSHGATYALMLLRPSLTYFIIARRWLASPHRYTECNYGMLIQVLSILFPFLSRTAILCPILTEYLHESFYTC